MNGTARQLITKITIWSISRGKSYTFSADTPTFYIHQTTSYVIIYTLLFKLKKLYFIIQIKIDMANKTIAKW